MTHERPSGVILRQKISLLVRDAERFSEALRIGSALLAAGASVTLICLCTGKADPGSCDRVPGDMHTGGKDCAALRITCCSDPLPAPACDYFPVLSLGQLAENLEAADIVIPW